MNNYFVVFVVFSLVRFVLKILLTSTPSLFKNLSSLFCLFILTITFFSSEIVDFGTINNDVLYKLHHYLKLLIYHLLFLLYTHRLNILLLFLFEIGFF
jgi:hypothetical protein